MTWAVDGARQAIGNHRPERPAELRQTDACRKGLTGITCRGDSAAYQFLTAFPSVAIGTASAAGAVAPVTVSVQACAATR